MTGGANAHLSAGQAVCPCPATIHSMPQPTCGSTTLSILLTGATGFVGSRLVRELLAQHTNESLIILGRGTPEQLRARTEKAVTWLESPALPPGALSRLRYISGDITVPGLGLTGADRACVSDSLTQAWHSAAMINLDGDPAPLYLTNVLGTRHLLDLVTEAPSADFVYVSTAYVAGRRMTGHVLEDDLYETWGFLTAYEESKYTAETMVHAWARRTGRCATIMRSSLLVTDQAVPVGLPRQPLDTLTRVVDAGMRSWSERASGLAEILKHGEHTTEAVRVRIAAAPGGALNMLQADYATRAMVRAAQAPRDGRPVRTFHLTHPRNTPVAMLCESFERRYPGLAVPVVPELTDPTPMEAMLAENAGVLGYTALRRTYDRTHLLGALGDLPDPKPIDVDYLVRGSCPPAATSTPGFHH